MLRLAAALALVIGVGSLLLELTLVGKAPWVTAEARTLRRVKDRLAAPESTATWTSADLARLPHDPDLRRVVALESTGVTVVGYVQRMLRAIDGDVHLDLVPDSIGTSGPLRPYVVAEVTDAWRLRHPAFGYERLTERLRPRMGGATAWDDGPARVRLTGWLLYDAPHEKRSPRDRYPAALSAWEVHPVTAIEVWNPGHGRFEELTH